MTFGWFCLWMFVVGFAIAPFTIGIV